MTRNITEGPGRISSLEYSADSRLSRMSTSDGLAATELLYDGRGYLRRSRLDLSDSTAFEQAEPTYSSEGLLHSRAHRRQVTRDGSGDGSSSSTTEMEEHITHLFYFAGRPAAQWRRGSTEELLYLTTDHLGTPLLATDTAGSRAWEGGLDPFGKPYLFSCQQLPGDGDTGSETDFLCAPPRTMEDAGILLRFPGQWEDSSFRSSGMATGVYYNLYRWYEVEIGRYATPDPLGLQGGLNLYLYAFGRPSLYTDRTGLQPCCERAESAGFFKEENGTQAGGIVVCCAGERVACANPRTESSTVAGAVVKDCILSHEREHFAHVPCPSTCELSRPKFKLFVSRNKAECAASKIELNCLRGGLSKCAGDSACIKRLQDRINNIVDYGRSFGKCVIE